MPPSVLPRYAARYGLFTAWPASLSERHLVGSSAPWFSWLKVQRGLAPNPLPFVLIWKALRGPGLADSATLPHLSFFQTASSMPSRTGPCQCSVVTSAVNTPPPAGAGTGCRNHRSTRTSPPPTGAAGSPSAPESAAGKSQSNQSATTPNQKIAGYLSRIIRNADSFAAVTW